MKRLPRLHNTAEMTRQTRAPATDGVPDDILHQIRKKKNRSRERFNSARG
jgi:hypothetical protein